MNEKTPIETLKQQMVDNFLGWRIPRDFCPDNGVSFNPDKCVSFGGMPIGSNLFTYEQAREMVDFMLTGVNREEEHRKSVEAVKGMQKSFEELGRKQEQMEYEELVKRIEKLERDIRIALNYVHSNGGMTKP